jgi:hypothetical protein
MAHKSRLMTLPTPPSPARADEHRPSVLVRTLNEAIVGPAGWFQPRIVSRESDDGTWEAWLEFVPVATTAVASYTTPIETHQQTRTAVERWASGITRVYAEGALGRATWRASRGGRR